MCARVRLHDSDLYAPDVEVKDAGQTFHGRDAVRAQYQSWLDAFAHMEVEVLDVIEATDAFAGEVRLTMKHTGSMATPTGPIPPIGRTVVLESCDVGRLRNGKLVSFHSYFDQLAILAQLGVLPEPAATSA
jgi:predicted ester cyclase